MSASAMLRLLLGRPVARLDRALPNRARLNRALPKRALLNRVLRLTAITLFLAVDASLAQAPSRPQPVSPHGAAVAPAARVLAVAHTGMTVSNMERSIAFYTEVLTFELVSDMEVAGEAFEQAQGVFGARARIVTLRLGDELLELTEYLAPRGRPIPVDSRSHDRWFQHVAIIVRDMDEAYARLRRHHVEHASTGPQLLPAWNPNAGGIRAFYFRDPDQHVLEILQFPPGKGDARWHRPSDRLFLGIDHTAIVAGDTERSLALYRDLLGMRVAGESENHGPEQERLNNVFGARLRITTLRAATGPGVELLEYLAPRDGRPFPADAKANDLVHWQTTLLTSDVHETYRALRSAGATLVSPAPVTLGAVRPGNATVLLVRDPDGHAMQLVERR